MYIRRATLAWAALWAIGPTVVWAEEPWRVLRATKAALSLELPAGWKMTELEVPGPDQQRVVLVRVSSRGPAARLSQIADLEIYVHSLPQDTEVARWVAAGHAAFVPGHLGELREARVAGLAGLARTVQFAGAEPMREVFLVANSRGLHIAWPQRPGLEFAVQHALDTLTLGAASTSPTEVGRASGPPQNSAPYGIVHPRIIAPADVPTRHDYRLVVAKAMQHLQLWFQAQIGNGVTFSMDDTVVLHSAQNESWFANNPAGSDPDLWFWRNGLEEAFGMAGGWFYDARNSWMVLVDVDPNCGSRAGGVANVVMLGRDQLRALTQQPFPHRCPQGNPSDTAVCHWVGRLGANLGSAFGVQAPAAACAANDTATCPDNLLWGGSARYPNTGLTPDEKAQFAASPFFSVLNLTRPLFSCQKLFAPPE